MLVYPQVTASYIDAWVAVAVLWESDDVDLQHAYDDTYPTIEYLIIQPEETKCILGYEYVVCRLAGLNSIQISGQRLV